ncbi:MAG: hypothetical protein M1840_001721 [Geoglossum simile]|nr:MAG: hypothetical protein M1840_001721 [Geoglossum simile]
MLSILHRNAQRAAIIDVDEANASEDASESVGEDEDEDEDEDEYQNADEYAHEDEEGGEDEDFVQHIIEDELEDKAEKDKDTMTYLSIWKAMVNNKEQREVLEHAAPRQLEVIRLQAVASYERCRAMDECPVELRGQRDIYDVTEILRMWHKQGKRNGPEDCHAAADSRFTRYPLKRDDRYQCRNKGKTCWINKLRPGVRDNAAEHYPVSGKIFRCWSREITNNLSTVEQSSQQIIVLFQLVQNLYGNGSNSPVVPSPYPPPYAPPVPLSPIHSSSDPSEVLIQFFDWLIAKSNAQQMEILDNIKNKLLDEDWNLDTLRDERKGGAMTTAIWESYGFKLGTVARMSRSIPLRGNGPFWAMLRRHHWDEAMPTRPPS